LNVREDGANVAMALGRVDCLVSIAGSDCFKSAFLDDCESGHADESLIFNHEHDRIAVAIRFAHFQPAVLRAE
jgi:hypothetical protein